MRTHPRTPGQNHLFPGSRLGTHCRRASVSSFSGRRHRPVSAGESLCASDARSKSKHLCTSFWTERRNEPVGVSRAYRVKRGAFRQPGLTPAGSFNTETSARVLKNHLSPSSLACGCLVATVPFTLPSKAWEGRDSSVQREFRGGQNAPLRIGGLLARSALPGGRGRVECVHF